MEFSITALTLAIQVEQWKTWLPRPRPMYTANACNTIRISFTSASFQMAEL